MYCLPIELVLIVLDFDHYFDAAGKTYHQTRKILGVLRCHEGKGGFGGAAFGVHLKLCAETGDDSGAHYFCPFGLRFLAVLAAFLNAPAVGAPFFPLGLLFLPWP